MGGARVTTLVTLRKCTLGDKREIKTLKFVSASTKGFEGGLAWIKPSKKDMAVTFSYSQGHRLRPPGEAERGLIQAYIDDLLVVADTLQHFVEGMELKPRNCAMATTEGVPGLQLRRCPHLKNPWHLVPAADSVPYLGLQLQPDGEFFLQRKHRLRLAAVHHWCLNTLAPPKVVQDVILAILGGVTQYVAPFIADDSDTARQLDHITVQVAKNRARYAFDASQDSLQDDRTLGLTRVPTRWQQAAVALVGTLLDHRSTSVRAEGTRIF